MRGVEPAGAVVSFGRVALAGGADGFSASSEVGRGARGGLEGSGDWGSPSGCGRSPGAVLPSWEPSSWDPESTGGDPSGTSGGGAAGTSREVESTGGSSCAREISLPKRSERTPAIGTLRRALRRKKAIREPLEREAPRPARGKGGEGQARGGDFPWNIEDGVR